MSDQENEMIEDYVEEEQLDEFKASMGDPSEVPEPTGANAKAPGPSKSQGDKSNPMQGSSEKAKAAEVPKTKMAMINAMVQSMNGMKKSDLAAAFGKMNKAMQSEEVEEDLVDKIELSAREELKVTTADIDIAEDVKEMFDGQDMSEEFVEKASTIFEAAVVAKINEQLEKVSVDIEGEITEAKEQIAEDLSAKLDSYLDYVVEQWMEDNQLAVEKGLSAEITTDFMNGLKDLFKEHYIDIPEDRVDVAEELATKADELEESLDSEIQKNAELKKELAEFKKAEIFAAVSDDLTETQVDKFSRLAEGVEFADKENYEGKLQMIKDTYFKSTEVNEESQLVAACDDEEPLELDEETTKSVDPTMAAYMTAISRTTGSRKAN